MLCDRCKKEILVEERTFGGLTVRPIEQLGVAFEDVVVPVGWRIPTLVEGVMLVNDGEFVEWSGFGDGNHDFYVIQPFIKNKGRYAAWLGCSSDGFGIGASGDLDYDDAARGVVLLKDKEN